MLHKVKACHGDILKGLPELNALLPPSVHKKRRLLEMARRGEQRPRQTKHPLGGALSRFVSQKSDTYDPIFDREIRIIAPHWFIPRTKTSSQNKKTLLEMARRSEPRPRQRTQIGRSLSDYTSKKSKTHDPDFTRKIRRLAPPWFKTRSELAEQKKRKLLGAARKGLPKPKQKTGLGHALYRYTSKKSKNHDPTFARQIKKLAPHWFKPCSTT